MADNQLVRIGENLLWLPAVRGIFGEEVRAMATINGTNSNNTLNGTSSADQITGYGGNDTINGGAGNDVLVGAQGIDQLTGGAGADVFVFSPGHGGSAPHDTITDFVVGTDRLSFTGGAVATSTEANAAGMWVVYGSGNDRVQLTGVHGATLAQLQNPSPPPPSATEGNDTIGGTNASESLAGLGGNDQITGYGGNDTINGGAGNDVIVGAQGTDRLTGGVGNDVFVFSPGHGGSAPHDVITDFVVGTDRLSFTGGAQAVATEADPNGMYVQYGSGNDWVQLLGVHDATIAQLTMTGTSPPPPPPPTGGGAPYPTGVAPTYAEEFTSGWGSWSHSWQSEEGIQQTGRGTILIGGSSESGSGIMSERPGNPASGFGDGLYQIRARMEGPGLGSGSGPALVLWPADDRWPGPEIDIGEIGGGGDLYMATHWNNGGRDAYNIYSAPGVDWRQWHEYAARLENNRITYYVDGQQIGVETQHPAPEYGKGGVNHIPSVMNRSSETMLEVDYFRFTDESALV